MSKSITGRDDFILARALYVYARQQQELERTDPTACQWSDAVDAVAILIEAFPGYACVFVEGDERRGRQPADLTVRKGD